MLKCSRDAHLWAKLLQAQLGKHRRRQAIEGEALRRACLSEHNNEYQTPCVYALWPLALGLPTM